MKLLLLILISFQLWIKASAVDSVIVSSPDKKISITVHYKDRLSYSIQYQGNLILQPSYIDLTLNNGKSLSDDLRIQRKAIQVFNEKIISPVPEKRKLITDNYIQLTLQFKQPYTLLFRIYN
ncbi:MAG: glycoside hydrolase family 97 N-terminal domain-containing protein, partial [Chitinophagaceae bacterium]|nr:glycoside hydrolase family 97 N-terminal domain-containing protein [Chitinophagaceae bacterium]